MHDLAYAELIDRLGRAGGLAAAAVDCVLAAADGLDALRAHIDGHSAAGRRVADIGPAPPAAAHAYLEQIAISGFRGVADRARLQLQAGPGLTLVVGRNGSGKSSFAEGLELLLTGTNLRWVDKTKVWQEGWRNLHSDTAMRLEARFRIDGEAEPVTISRDWPAGSRLAGGEPIDVKGAGDNWEALGWAAALERYRPLLSYNELGAMFSSRASALYDALSSVLGLEDFDGVHKALREVRLQRERTGKDEKAERALLTERLRGNEDARAAAVLGEIAKRTPVLETVEAHVLASQGTDDATTDRLRGAAAVAVPCDAETTAAVRGLDVALERLRTLQATDGTRLDALADVLDSAVSYHDRHSERTSLDCPVCGTPDVLDVGWSLRAQAELQLLRARSADLRAARQALREARDAVCGLFAPATATIVRAAAAAGLESTSAESGLDAFSALLAADDRALAGGGEAAAATLAAALADLREQALHELERRDSAWRPARDAIVRWLASARSARHDKQALVPLKSAESWMATCMAELRNERLAPVVQAAQANWALLRHDSNVALGEVKLTKSGMQRFVSFDVAVDGTASSAFGVMSQGELSALAISIFLPRASLPDSPFGFMVIDDPVQSMDPAKVDGLARVLAGAARSRQVVVLTHDERLPEAVRRLAIDARVIRVHRRARSKVEVVAGPPPSDRYLAEAVAMAKTAELPAEVRARVVPGFCRSAIEAACAGRVRRRLLDRGTSHAVVEEELEAIASLNGWLCAAFDLSTAQGHELNAQLRRLGGDEAVAVVRLAKKASHVLVAHEALDLIAGAKRLVRSLESA